MKKILFVLLLGSLLSCQKSKENSENQATTPDSTTFTNERNTFFSNLLAPSEAAAQLQATGAEFNASLMHDPKKYTQRLLLRADRPTQFKYRTKILTAGNEIEGDWTVSQSKILLLQVQRLMQG